MYIIDKCGSDLICSGTPVSVQSWNVPLVDMVLITLTLSLRALSSLLDSSPDGLWRETSFTGPGRLHWSCRTCTLAVGSFGQVLGEYCLGNRNDDHSSNVLPWEPKMAAPTFSVTRTCVLSSHDCIRGRVHLQVSKTKNSLYHGECCAAQCLMGKGVSRRWSLSLTVFPYSASFLWGPWHDGAPGLPPWPPLLFVQPFRSLSPPVTVTYVHAVW